MKKMIKKIVFLLTLGMILMTLCGCEEKIDPEELRKYAEMCDPETLREYAAMLEEVADELEAKELESDTSETEEELEEDSEEEEDETTEETDAEDEEADAEAEAETDDTDAQAEETDEEDADEVDIDADDFDDLDVVELSLSEQYESEDTIVYETADGKEKLEVSYHIPSIDDGSEAAEKINEEIYEFVKDSVELAKELADGTAKDKFEIPAFTNVDYVVYQYNDIASIIVTGTDSDNNRQFKVFNYNTKTQEAVSEEDILKYLDMEDKDLDTYISNTIGAYVLSDVDEYIDLIDELYGADMPSVASVLGLVASLYQVTVSQTDILDDMMLYVNEDGIPCIVGKVVLPDELGEYYIDMALDTSLEPEMFKKYQGYTEKYHYPELEMDAFVLDEGNGYTFEIPKEYRTDDFDFESVTIGFDGDDDSEFVVTYKTGKEEIRYTGDITLAGFSDKGIEFEYSLDKCNGEKLTKNNIKKGTFSLLANINIDDKGNISYQGAEITSIDGYDFTGAEGETVVFDMIEGIK